MRGLHLYYNYFTDQGILYGISPHTRAIRELKYKLDLCACLGLSVTNSFRNRRKSMLRDTRSSS